MGSQPREARTHALIDREVSDKPCQCGEIEVARRHAAASLRAIGRLSQLHIEVGWRHGKARHRAQRELLPAQAQQAQLALK
jgi:hypothetical protein